MSTRTKRPLGRRIQQRVFRVLNVPMRLVLGLPVATPLSGTTAPHDRPARPARTTGPPRPGALGPAHPTGAATADNPDRRQSAGTDELPPAAGS